MKRTVVIMLSAAGVVLLSGGVHGYLTERWYRSTEVEEAAARLADIPEHFGPWTAAAEEPIPANELQAAGAEGCWQRSFTSATTGHKVHVVLMVGRTGQMSVHRPENCYPGQGYNLASGAPLRRTIKTTGGPDAEFFTARFVKPEVTTGTSELRIYWTWNASGRWQAPEYPRATFAREPYLFKLYVIRELPQRAERAEDDPATVFLRLFLPVLCRALAPGS
jgi:hypothetical protein